MIKKVLTYSEAKELSFFGAKRTILNTIYYHHYPTVESTETFWQSSSNFNYSFDALTNFGSWNSLMCFMDKGPQYKSLHDITFCIWPALTIYSDDLSEIIGVSVYVNGKNSDSSVFRTYLKEDGYDKVFNFSEYSKRIQNCKENNLNYGRAAFYLTPNEFDGFADKKFYELIIPEIANR